MTETFQTSIDLLKRVVQGKKTVIEECEQRNSDYRARIIENGAIIMDAKNLIHETEAAIRLLEGAFDKKDPPLRGSFDKT